MSLKIDTNSSVVAFHVLDGPVTFPYKADALSAVSRHPLEWSLEPWDHHGAERGRKHIIERHERETREAEERARAKHFNAPAPLKLPDPVELTPEEREAIEQHDRAVEEAKERLRAFREKKAAEKAEADQVAADEALVRSPPPRPDPGARRPFGRSGEPTAKEREMMQKRDEKIAREKADAERMDREKAQADRIAAAEANGAKLTT